MRTLKSLELVLFGRGGDPTGIICETANGPAQAVPVPETASEHGQQQPSDAAQTNDVRRLSDREQMILMQSTQGASNTTQDIKKPPLKSISV